jgi:hypothetical protein
LSKNITAFQKDVRALISKCDGLENAARIVDVSPTDLREIADGAQKNISKDAEQILNRFVSLTDSDFVTELTKEIDSVRYQLRKKVRASEAEFGDIFDSPLPVYFQRYMWKPIGLLEQVNKISNGEEPSVANLAVSMYRFSELYELFRPAPINHYEPYYGTVKMMDSIFGTLSQAFDLDLGASFSKYGNILSAIQSRQPLEREKVDWEQLEQDLVYVSRMIDQTITEYSLKNYRQFTHTYHFFFKQAVEDYLKQNFEGIHLAEDIEETVSIHHNSVTVITNLGPITYEKLGNFYFQLRQLELAE